MEDISENIIVLPPSHKRCHTFLFSLSHERCHISIFGKSPLSHKYKNYIFSPHLTQKIKGVIFQDMEEI